MLSLPANFSNHLLIKRCGRKVRVTLLRGLRKMDSKFTPVVAAATGLAYKTSCRVGRGVPDITNAYTKKCSCSRDKTIVFCRACGYYCNGRIRLKCEQHPRVTFLLDIAECPRCHSSVFLDEYPRN